MAYLPAWCDSVAPIRRGLRAVWQHLPSDCPLCGCAALGGFLCDGCRLWVTGSMRVANNRCKVCCLRLDQQTTCPDCAMIQPAYERIVAAFDYAEPGDLLLHRLKVRRNFFMADTLASLLLGAMTSALLSLPENTVVVCVPASRAAILRRGFNPAAEIARCVAARLGLPYRPHVVKRVHEGRKQAYLSRVERASSVQALYACNSNLGGTEVAIVDDVMTTGSTINSIALTLRAAGAAKVYGLVVARTPYVSVN